jgi:hypothetical protein
MTGKFCCFQNLVFPECLGEPFYIEITQNIHKLLGGEVKKMKFYNKMQSNFHVININI